jgi:hypothetical protein
VCPRDDGPSGLQGIGVAGDRGGPRDERRAKGGEAPGLD